MKIEVGTRTARFQLHDGLTGGPDGQVVDVISVSGKQAMIKSPTCDNPMLVPLSTLTPAQLPPRARNTDPWTSGAAGAISTERLSQGRREALCALYYAGRAGLTDFELAERTGKQQTSIGKRRGELVERGYVVDSGHTRLAPSGARSIVWQCTEAGVTVWRSVLDREGAA